MTQITAETVRLFMRRPEARGREKLTESLFQAGLNEAQVLAALAASNPPTAQDLRIAEARENAALFNKSRRRAKAQAIDHRPLPASDAVAAARALGDAQRRARGLAPRTGL